MSFFENVKDATFCKISPRVWICRGFVVISEENVIAPLNS